MLRTLAISTIGMTIFTFTSAVFCRLIHAEDRGALVIVGGGGTPSEAIAEAVQLAGGIDSRVVILPQASNLADRGTSSIELFREHKVGDIQIVDLDDPATARAAIERANLIWFPGGQQSQLIEALTQADVVETIRQRNRAGAVVGGTSAGAAVMSALMIPNSPAMPSLRSGNTPIAKGLGLAESMIIDQHFVERERMNRLLGAIVDHPQQIGVGIGERTAIVVRGQKFTVIGAGSVVVVDARSAAINANREDKLQTATNVRVDVLAAGDEFEFQNE